MGKRIHETPFILNIHKRVRYLKYRGYTTLTMNVLRGESDYSCLEMNVEGVAIGGFRDHPATQFGSADLSHRKVDGCGRYMSLSA